MNIRIKEESCQNLHELLEQEWLEVNGLGGYASSTLAGCHTRKYHGLLVANLPAPACGRHVLLSKFEDSVLAGDTETFLSAHQYPGVLFPPGPFPLRHFNLAEFPTWTFRIGDSELRRSLIMVHGQNTVILRYTLHKADHPLTLRLKPFIAFRRNHALTHENPAFRQQLRTLCHGFALAPYDGMPHLTLQWSPGRIQKLAVSGEWYRNFEYDQERQRGYDCQEDLFMPAVMDLVLPPDEDIYVTAATGELEADTIADLWHGEVMRRQKNRLNTLAFTHNLTRETEQVAVFERLLAAAEQFVITTPTGRPAVIAGYHWFEDWGRDTMLALPGLAFVAGRRDVGFAVLQSFLQWEKDGLLPNFIGPDNLASYNSVDTSLWFFWTVQQYLRAGGELEKVHRFLWPAMKQIIQAYAGDHDHGLLDMDENGLLQAGNAETQLTWMDAQVEGHPATPRWGYAVEINALWYNAITFSDELGRIFQDKRLQLPVAPSTLAKAFRDLFWLPDDGYLADIVNDNEADRALRPNQIFAVSLPFSPLTRVMQEAVVDTVTRVLLTPYGLRTLAPVHPSYCGRYQGDQAARDLAYHQGTVWPWLFGAYIEAYLKTHRNSKPAREFIQLLLQVWREHLTRAGLGTISEIFDGDPPHRPNGCIAQAWSVGEIIRSFSLFWDAEKKGSWWLTKK